MSMEWYLQGGDLSFLDFLEALCLVADRRCQNGDPDPEKQILEPATSSAAPPSDNPTPSEAKKDSQGPEATQNQTPAGEAKKVPGGMTSSMKGLFGSKAAPAPARPAHRGPPVCLSFEHLHIRCYTDTLHK